ncbi:helix-turn-helix domain-containing protein [Jiella sp. M17.18]|uniref:helix-turn-helix domain-containing protein n=1 Tax=Jiella sp. M17.18 TaxID=3234247 RepID=UPI0034DFBF76
MQAARISAHRFSTDMVEPKYREEAFRSRIASLFEVSEIAPFSGEPVRSTIDSFHFGSLIINAMACPGFTRERPRHRLMRDFLDHLMIRIDLDGPIASGGAPIAVAVTDLGRVSPRVRTPPHTVSVVVPRRALEDRADAVAARHGDTLAHPAALFLADHIVSVVRMAGRGGETVPGAIPAMTPGLIAACLADAAPRDDVLRDDLRSALVVQVRRMIERDLADPRLGPERIARAIGVSRSSLYRLFEEAGGVATVIRESRLKAAARDLLQPDPSLRIGDLAHRFCFSSDAHFSRTFRDAFGCTPSEFRAAGLDRSRPTVGGPGTASLKTLLPTWLAVL